MTKFANPTAHYSIFDLIIGEWQVLVHLLSERQHPQQQKGLFLIKQMLSSKVTDKGGIQKAIDHKEAAAWKKSYNNRKFPDCSKRVQARIEMKVRNSGKINI